MKNKLITYIVSVHEEPYQYTIEAKNKREAEDIAIHNHNGSQWEEIRQVTSRLQT